MNIVDINTVEVGGDVCREDEKDSCSLCLEPVLLDEAKVTVLSCGHTLHTRCLQNFAISFARRSTSAFVCPLCRAPILEDDTVGIDTTGMSGHDFEHVTEPLVEILRSNCPAGSPSTKGGILLAKFSMLNFFEENSSLEMPMVPESLRPLLASRKACITPEAVGRAIERTAPNLSCSFKASSSPRLDKFLDSLSSSTGAQDDTRTIKVSRRSGTGAATAICPLYSVVIVPKGTQQEVMAPQSQPTSLHAPVESACVPKPSVPDPRLNQGLEPEKIFQNAFASLVGLHAEEECSSTMIESNTSFAIEDLSRHGERNLLAARLFLCLIQSTVPVVLHEKRDLDARNAWLLKGSTILPVLKTTWLVMFFVGFSVSIVMLISRLW